MYDFDTTEKSTHFKIFILAVSAPRALRATTTVTVSRRALARPKRELPPSGPPGHPAAEFAPPVSPPDPGRAKVTKNNSVFPLFYFNPFAADKNI